MKYKKVAKKIFKPQYAVKLFRKGLNFYSKKFRWKGVKMIYSFEITNISSAVRIM